MQNLSSSSSIADSVVPSSVAHAYLASKLQHSLMLAVHAHVYRHPDCSPHAVITILRAACGNASAQLHVIKDDWHFPVSSSCLTAAALVCRERRIMESEVRQMQADMQALVEADLEAQRVSHFTPLCCKLGRCHVSTFVEACQLERQNKERSMPLSMNQVLVSE